MNIEENDQNPKARIGQLLVAVLLGEASAAEAAEVEAALQASPELRAERERLEATIGLVRGLKDGGGPQRLSPESAAALAQAAERMNPFARARETGPSASRPWYSTSAFRIAASAALILGALASWRALDRRKADATGQGFLAYGLTGDENGAPVDIVVAQLDAEKAKNQPESLAKKEGEEPQAEMVAPVAAPSGAEEMAQTRTDRFADEASTLGLDGSTAPAAPPEPRALFAATVSSEADLKRDQELMDAKMLERLTSLGYTSGDVAMGEAAPPPTEPQRQLDAVPAEPRPAERASAPSAFAGRRAGGGGRAARAEPEPSLPPGASASESNEFYLGKGEAAAEYRFDSLEAFRGLGYIGDNESRDDDGGEAKDRFAGEQRLGEKGWRERALSPADRAAAIDVLLHSCRRQPSERPRDMFFRWWGDNPFEIARHDPLSTFSIDVDTASYTLARRYLSENKVPEKAQIRTEEFLNYFKGDVPAPTESTFAIATELAPSLFNTSPDTWMLRVAVRGKEVSKTERNPLALTFVVDVSGSMSQQNRLELVKHTLRLLVGELDPRDSIALVAFRNEATMVLPMTSAKNRALIESALHPLSPEGGTNVQAGLRMGYEAALAGLSSEANNRVVLLSDGVGNIGETDAQRLNQEVEHAREREIYLNTIGVGMGNHNDAFLEQLADKGDGICNYVDDAQEARRAMVDNFTGAFEPIARDVKIQVEFDPAQVERYRLLGYENRAVADKDFRNDAVDAGEVGAGHQVVALYELVRATNSDPAGPLATVRLRWKQPWKLFVGNQLEELPASEMAHPVVAGQASGSFAATSAGYRRSVLVAQLAELLRRSIHARDDSFETLLSESRKLSGELADPDFDEFVKMIERTIALLSTEWGHYDALARRLDALRMQRYLRAQLEDLQSDLERSRLEEFDRHCQELEDEIRAILNR